MKKILLFTFFVFVHWFGYAQQNTIIIIADDLGTDYLGFYPNDGDTANTPVLRSLLDEGVLFSNAWSNPFVLQRVPDYLRADILSGPEWGISLVAPLVLSWILLK